MQKNNNNNPESKMNKEVPRGQDMSLEGDRRGTREDGGMEG